METEENPLIDLGNRKKFAWDYKRQIDEALEGQLERERRRASPFIVELACIMML